MIIKFDSAFISNVPGDYNYQSSGIVVTVDILLSPATIGYRTFIEDIGDVRIKTGDYLYQESGVKKVILSADYASNPTLKRLVTREIGEDLMESIIQGFVDLATTDLNKLDILRTIGPCMDMIVANKIQAALVIANVIATTVNFTQARKNALIALIQAAADKL